MSVDDPKDLSTWTTFWTKLCRGVLVNLGGRNALEYIKDCTPPLRDVFQSAIDWTPAGSRVHINEMYYWMPQRWNNIGGRVTLAGDAAHLMLHCMCTLSSSSSILYTWLHAMRAQGSEHLS